MLFHAWHSPHWPTHLVLVQPQSPQVYSAFDFVAMQQNYQSGSTPSLT
jgi:hypothetical protein